MTSPVQGSSSAFQHPHHSSMSGGIVSEQQLRTRSGAGNAAGADTAQTQATRSTGAVQAIGPEETRRADIKNYVTGVFTPYRNGANSAEIEELINSRTEGLFATGHSRAQIEANLETKAPAEDTLTAVSAGALSATPFIISPSVAPKVTQAIGKFVEISSPASPQVAGAVGGATAMVLKSIGDKLFEKASKKNLWLVPDEAHLSGAMKKIHQNNQSVHIDALNSILGGLGYTGRNIGQAILSALKNNKIDLAYSAMGNWAAGGVGAKAVQLNETRRGAIGSAWLLARNDFTDRYAQLDRSQLQEHVVKGAIRGTGDVLSGVFNFKNWAEGVGNAVTPKGIADAVILAAGVAGSSTITDMVAKKMEGSEPALQALTSGLANASVAWIAYAAQGAGGVYMKAIAEAVDKLTERAITAGAEAIAEGANQGLTAGISGATRGINATVRGWQATKRVIASAPHDIQEGVRAAGRGIATGTAPARAMIAQATHNATDAIGDLLDEGTRRAGDAINRANIALHGQRVPQAQRDIPLAERRDTGLTTATTGTSATTDARQPPVNPSSQV